MGMLSDVIYCLYHLGLWSLEFTRSPAMLKLEHYMAALVLGVPAFSYLHM